MITVAGQSSGTGASAATVTITLPTYTAGDSLLLLTARNQADSAAWAGDANAAVAEVANAGPRRVSALWVTPSGGATSFVLTATIAAIWQWVCLNLGSTGQRITTTASNAVGSNTTAAIPIPATTLAPASGQELALAAAGTNSTAVWATDANTVFQGAAAPGLFVRSARPTVGAGSMSYADANRGNEGTTRIEASLSLVVAPAAATWAPRITVY